MTQMAVERKATKTVGAVFLRLDANLQKGGLESVLEVVLQNILEVVLQVSKAKLNLVVLVAVGSCGPQPHATYKLLLENMALTLWI